MNDTRQQLILAEQKATKLFRTVEERGLIVPGKSEKELCNEIVQIAKDDFGVENHWHKKIVRTGINTLQPFRQNRMTWLFRKMTYFSLIFIQFLKAGMQTLAEPISWAMPP
ncbi:MAG: hypothetical protein ABIQ31_26060 [Ferruginibacter sp.]